MDWETILGNIEDIEEANERFVKRVENLIVRKRKLEEIVDGRYEAREGSKKQILEINSEIRSVIINRQDKEEEAAVKNIKTDSKEFFRYAKKHKELRSKIGPLKLDDGLGYQRGPKKMAEILGRQFESVFSTPKVDFTDLILPSYDIEELCDMEITEEELKYLRNVYILFRVKPC